ncbi:hypothetical protein [Methylophilus sp. YYY-1]|uniref:hypothetical protein n=1 Tax=Methylophilus sp. YYY-1 TaxID=2682087 RepID=UPI0023B28462|nr:hypothetical protein [Methylophilus sp. YYY-1]MDF0377520.1 hypothetical protein [Methylophilus sp. YYY-1]
MTIKFDTVKVGFESPDLHKKIQIALANIPVWISNIESSYLEKPNHTKERLKPISELLNSVSRWHGSNGEKIDLLIFPEVSIPHAWESMIVAWARKHHIGVICGLEHNVVAGIAYNDILAALPFKTTSKHWACVPIRRTKRIYSPNETFVLENEGLQVPSTKDKYHLFQWRGASFAIYNCYELASIEDRTIFKGKVDFIVGSEYNRDVSYFSNIVESVSRDLHCFVVQVNGSQYGDSRVVSPSSSEKMNPLGIKGGDNLTFLTMSLNLKSLRNHQRKGYGLQKDSDDFKPTPPGLDIKDVKARINLGK